MLQPSASPAPHQPPAFSGDEQRQPQAPQRAKPPPPSLWQWLSTKELLFIFVVCSLGVLLFRTRDSYQLVPVWREPLERVVEPSSDFPLYQDILPAPIVTDLDSDGNQDMLLMVNNNILKLFTFPGEVVLNTHKPHVMEAKKPKGDVRSVNVIEDLGEGVRPVGMGAGYLQKYQSMLQVRHQVVVVLMSDWTVLCYDHTLSLLWKSTLRPKKQEQAAWEEGLSITEASVLVTSVNIHKGDYGAIIVGGRETEVGRPEESINRMKRVVTQENEADMLETAGHYTVYALEGRGGDVRWHHTPQDFQMRTAYEPEASPFRHLKLLMFRYNQHQGEVSWHQYSEVIRQTLPHSWQYSADTHFSLAHFKKDKRPSERSEMTDHISKVGDLAMDHIAGLAFGGQQPHSSSEHVQDPNVIILHSIKGIEVMHLYHGRPLCSLSLSPFHVSHADINADGVIDHVAAINNPGQAGFSENEEEAEGADCYGRATSMDVSSKPLFKHSICKATHWTENFVAIDEWFPQLNKAGRKRVKNDLTEPVSPILIPSAYHSAPLKLHMGGRGWDINGVVRSLFGTPSSSPSSLPPFSSTTSPAETLYDSVFVLSSGRVTSIGPHGEFNWQVDTAADWDAASHVIYNPSHPSWDTDPERIQFIHNSFSPSAMAFSPKAYGKKDHILIMGWDVMTLLSGEDGEPLSTIRLPKCHPVVPVLVADFTGDGWNDVIVTCPDKYWGVSLDRKSGFWHTSLLGILVGVIVVVFAVYARQRTVGFLPPIKTAQD